MRTIFFSVQDAIKSSIWIVTGTNLNFAVFSVQGASLDPSLRMLQQHPHQDHPSLGEELMVGAEAPSAECRPTSLQLSYDSPVTEQPASADGASPTDRANSSRSGVK